MHREESYLKQKREDKNRRHATANERLPPRKEELPKKEKKRNSRANRFATQQTLHRSLHSRDTDEP